MTLRCWDVSRKSSGVLLSSSPVHFPQHIFASPSSSAHNLVQFSIPAKTPPSSETQALTMAEPSSVRQKSGWNSLPTEVIKLIVSRVDNLSTMQGSWWQRGFVHQAKLCVHSVPCVSACTIPWYVPPRSAAQSRREGRKYQTSTCWLEFPPSGTHLVQAVSQSPQLNK